MTDIEALLSEAADKIVELQDENRALRNRIDVARDLVESCINAITHPHGQRAHFIDSADQIRADALTEMLGLLK